MGDKKRKQSAADDDPLDETQPKRSKKNKIEKSPREKKTNKRQLSTDLRDDKEQPVRDGQVEESKSRKHKEKHARKESQKDESVTTKNKKTKEKKSRKEMIQDVEAADRGKSAEKADNVGKVATNETGRTGHTKNKKSKREPAEADGAQPAEVKKKNKDENKRKKMGMTDAIGSKKGTSEAVSDKPGKELATEAGQSEYQQSDSQQESPEQQKGGRFIVFIGNLPFTATQESVENHFCKINPISVRVATEKGNSGKCRGFGFLEFQNYDRMQTCLKLYHHSSLDDGKSPARRINVELTAGGGGKSQTRKDKLEEKNRKLAEERDRTAKEQKKKREKNVTTTRAIDDLADVHPSRREWIPGV
ncbi:hypothetical protein Egran_06881 [Elaphomyces granulatus]|uniref:RRM domain-containing protein n=1 Tax=Elaphomyces granulatus TaxID=519963 RepID=A0A232LMH5_9EURO|nr:hypothetical protein Egran_06881 [Elaphomyces granulatus]